MRSSSTSTIRNSSQLSNRRPASVPTVRPVSVLTVRPVSASTVRPVSGPPVRPASSPTVRLVSAPTASTSSSSQYLRKSTNPERNANQILSTKTKEPTNVQKIKRKKSVLSNNQLDVYIGNTLKNKETRKVSESKKGQRLSVVIPCIATTPTSKSSSDRNQRYLLLCLCVDVCI
jgi:hypothetical protein